MASARTKPTPKPTIATVEDYLEAKARGWQKTAARTLMAIVAEVCPDATVSIKWGQPLWELHGPMAWLRAASGHLSFGFWRGADLDDPEGILEGEGLKMRHVKLGSPEAIDRAALTKLVQQAVELNRRGGDPTRPR